MSILRELLFYLLFLYLLLMVAYGNRDPWSVYIYQSMENTYAKGDSYNGEVGTYEITKVSVDDSRVLQTVKQHFQIEALSYWRSFQMMWQTSIYFIIILWIKLLAIFSNDVTNIYIYHYYNMNY